METILVLTFCSGTFQKCACIQNRIFIFLPAIVVWESDTFKNFNLHPETFSFFDFTNKDSFPFFMFCFFASDEYP